MATNPESKWPTPDIQTATRQDIRLRWSSTIDGLIEAAMHGNVRAFEMVRNELFGTPISGTEEAIAEISLEDLLSSDKDGLQGPGQWPSAGNGGSMMQILCLPCNQLIHSNF